MSARARPAGRHPTMPTTEGLAAALDCLLPGTADQRRAFIDAASADLKEHSNDRPVVASQWRRLDAVGKAARAFANQVKKLNGMSRLFLALGWSDATGRPAGGPYDRDGFRMKLLDALVVARETADAADWVLARRRRQRPRDEHDANTLVAMIAYSYADAFGHCPSAAREGIFARALRVLLPLGGVDQEIGETRLRGILTTASIPGKPAGPGRKARSD